MKDGMEVWTVGALEAGLPNLEAKGAHYYQKALPCSSPTLIPIITSSELFFFGQIKP